MNYQINADARIENVTTKLKGISCCFGIARHSADFNVEIWYTSTFSIQICSQQIKNSKHLWSRHQLQYKYYYYDHYLLNIWK